MVGWPHVLGRTSQGSRTFVSWQPDHREKEGDRDKIPRDLPAVTYFLQLHPILGISFPECELLGSISCPGSFHSQLTEQPCASLSSLVAFLSKSSLLRGGALSTMGMCFGVSSV